MAKRPGFWVRCGACGWENPIPTASHPASERTSENHIYVVVDGNERHVYCMVHGELALTGTFLERAVQWDASPDTYVDITLFPVE